jgi:hypothetical protein
MIIVIKEKEKGLGRDNPDFIAYTVAIAKLFNQHGMVLLNKQNEEGCLKILKLLCTILRIYDSH